MMIGSKGLAVGLAGLLAGCVGSWIPQTSNVPSSRLGSSYASPDGGYTVKVPYLHEGARIQEGTEPPNQFVLFADYHGSLYLILSRDKQTGEDTFEQLESDVKIGASPFGRIWEKETVTTISSQWSSARIWSATQAESGSR